MKIEHIKVPCDAFGFESIAPPHFFHMKNNEPQRLQDKIATSARLGKRALRRLKGRRAEFAHRMWQHLCRKKAWRE